MTRAETKQILAIIGVYYPNYHPENKELAVNAWHEVLEDLDYNQIAMALKIYARTNTSGFAPTPGQLIECISIDRHHSPEEAWAMVSKALTNGIYGWREEYDKLPPMVQRAVGRAENLRGWAQMDADAVQSVIHSHFLRAYNAQSDKETKMRKLPENVRGLIEGVTRRINDGTF